MNLLFFLTICILLDIIYIHTYIYIYIHIGQFLFHKTVMNNVHTSIDYYKVNLTEDNLPNHTTIVFRYSKPVK